MPARDRLYWPILAAYFAALVAVSCAVFKDSGPNVYSEPATQYTDSENQNRFGVLSMKARDAGLDAQSR